MDELFIQRMPNLISLRKNTADISNHESIVTLDHGIQKISFKLLNEKEFLSSLNVKSNINLLRSTMDNYPKDKLQMKTNIIKIQKFIKEMTICSLDNPAIPKSHSFLSNCKATSKLSKLNMINDPSFSMNSLKFSKRGKTGKELGEHFKTPVTNESFFQDNSKLILKQNIDKDMKDKTLKLIKKLTQEDYFLGRKANINISTTKEGTTILRSNSKFNQLKQTVNNIVIKEEEDSREELNKAENDLDIPLDKCQKSPFNYLICFICEQYNLKNDSFSMPCGHIVCLKCSKKFYEDKVESGEKDVFCPDFRCKTPLSIDDLSMLIQPSILDLFIKNQSKRADSKYDTKLKQLEEKIEDFKFFSQRNVFQVKRDNEIMIKFSKMSKEICKMCYLPALYGKFSKNMVKCLNCYYKYCKFCMKEFTHDHFLITSSTACKVYFKKKAQQALNKEETSKFVSYLIYLLLFLISYFLLVFGIFLLFHSFLRRQFRLKTEVAQSARLVKYIIVIVIDCFFIIILLIIGWFFYPFYPLVTAILN